MEKLIQIVTHTGVRGRREYEHGNKEEWLRVNDTLNEIRISTRDLNSEGSR